MFDRRSLLLAGGALAFAPIASARSGPVEAAMEVGDQRVRIAATLNGQGPFPFVLDTGAEISGIQAELARRLGLEVQRQVRLGGRPFDLYAVDELVLGGAVRQEDAALFGLDRSPNLGGDGLLAAGLVTTLDSELLFESGLWRVHPEGLIDPPGYEVIEARLEAPRVAGLSTRIHGPVDVGGQRVDAVFDTGAPHALSIPAAVAQRLGLMNEDRPFAPVASSGIQGRAAAPARLMKAPPLTVGSQTFDEERMIVRIADDTAGAVILGYPVLRRLDLALSNGRRRIGVRRNALRAVDRPYGLSGLWVEAAGDAVRVEVVGARSPAADAGLVQGDVITNLGPLDRALPALRGTPGTEIPLTVRRRGETLQTTLRLRDFLSD